MTSRWRAACWAALFGAALLSFDDVPPAAAAPGDLVPGFGTNGVADLNLGAVPRAVAAQNSKIVFGGAANGAFRIMRIDDTGAPDDDFGGDGLVTVAPSQSATALNLHSVHILSDDRVLAAGVADRKLFVVRLLPDGRRDTSFDEDGRATVQPAEFAYSGASLAVQTDGKVLVAATGTRPLQANFTMSLTRLRADGSVDLPYSGNGISTTTLDDNTSEFARAATQGSDSKVYYGGLVSANNVAGTGGAKLVRRNADGSFDPSFGPSPGGSVTVPSPLSGNQMLEYTDLAKDSNGKVLGIGHTVVSASTGTPSRRALAVRIQSSGSPDPTYGTSGRAEINPDGSSPDQLNGDFVAGVRNPDGSAVAAGWWNQDSTRKGAMLVRFTPQGGLDTSFGPETPPTTLLAPRVATVLGAFFTVDLARLGNGHLVALGTPSASSGTHALVARFFQECTLILGCTLVAKVSGTGTVFTASISSTGTPVGIIVRRLVGKRKVLVGRVPLGRQRKGRRAIRWNLKVRGRRVKAGRYEITLRAFDRRNRRIVDLSRPVVVRVPPAP
jgi:uncharacterized delta-60 repeat protein